jgi:RNA polymerase sigma factor (sigma-70 family)
LNIELELITGCLNKERKAQYDLYKKTYGFLMAICRRYANSSYEADDLLNIGFLKILNNLDKYQPKIPFGIWIRKVMINTIIDEFRKNISHKEKISYVEEHFDSNIQIDLNEALSSLNMEEIQTCIDQLPPVSKKVFNLFIIDGYSHKEIADLLNISEGTSKWHVNFSRIKLQELITTLFNIPQINLIK